MELRDLRNKSLSETYRERSTMCSVIGSSDYEITACVWEMEEY